MATGGAVVGNPVVTDGFTRKSLSSHLAIPPVTRRIIPLFKRADWLTYNMGGSLGRSALNQSRDRVPVVTHHPFLLQLIQLPLELFDRSSIFVLLCATVTLLSHNFLLQFPDTRHFNGKYNTVQQFFMSKNMGTACKKSTDLVICAWKVRNLPKMNDYW